MGVLAPVRANKKITNEAWEAYLEYQKISTAIGLLKKQQEDCKQKIKQAFGKAEKLKTPDGVLTKSIVQVKGHYVKAFSYPKYKHIAR